MKFVSTIIDENVSLGFCFVKFIYVNSLGDSPEASSSRLFQEVYVKKYRHLDSSLRNYKDRQEEIDYLGIIFDFFLLLLITFCVL